MERYLGNKIKMRSSEGKELLIKYGVREIDKKCKIEKDNGKKGESKKSMYEYGVKLSEKKKVRSIYGVMESKLSK